MIKLFDNLCPCALHVRASLQLNNKRSWSGWQRAAGLGAEKPVSEPTHTDKFGVTMIDNMQEFETMIGQDLYELKSELRLSLNAQAELDEFLAEHSTHLSEDFLSELTEDLQQAIDKLDESIVERLMHMNDHSYSQHDQYEYEYDNARPDAYYPEFVSDVRGWGRDNKAFVNTAYRRNSRSEFKRTSGPEKRIILTEIGSFDLTLTSKTAAAWMRVTRPVRNGVPHIQVGAVSINLSNGQLKCGVYDCDWKKQLTHIDPQVLQLAQITSTEDELPEFDREWAEYQLLKILEHLGTHSHRYPNSPFHKFMAEPKRYRDGMAEKFETRKAVTQ